MKKRSRTAKWAASLSYLPYIALADILIGFAGFLLMTNAQMKAEVQTQVARLEERKAALAAEVADIEAKRAETGRLLEEERAKKEAEIHARITEQEALLEQKKQDFQNWDWVVNRFRVSRGMSRKPDAHLYLRSRGIYRDGSKKALTDEQVLAFFQEQSGSSGSTPDGKALVAVWQENGANDQYIRVIDLEEKIPGLDDTVVVYGIILPNGVRAGPEQKGTEPIEKKGGGQ